MALDKTNLFSSSTTSAFPRVEAKEVRVKKFDAISGGKTLKVLHPVAYNTSTNLWVPLDGNGSNGTDTIKGFVYPEAIVLDDSGDTNLDVLGNVLLAGEVHYDDILALGTSDSSPTGEIDATTAELKAACQQDTRTIGITVTGVEGVR